MRLRSLLAQIVGCLLSIVLASTQAAAQIYINGGYVNLGGSPSEPIDVSHVPVVVNGNGGIQSDALSVSFGDLRILGDFTLTLLGTTYSFRDVETMEGATINGDLGVRGLLTPDDGLGMLNINGNLSMQQGSSFLCKLDSANQEALNIHGAVDLSGSALSLEWIGDVGIPGLTTRTIITADEGIGNPFEVEPILGEEIGGGVVFQGLTYGLDRVDVHFLTIPEPTSIVLLMMGTLTLTVYWWRRRPVP